MTENPNGPDRISQLFSLLGGDHSQEQIRAIIQDLPPDELKLVHRAAEIRDDPTTWRLTREIPLK